MPAVLAALAVLAVPAVLGLFPAPRHAAAAGPADPAPAAPAGPGRCETSVPFVSGTEGYHGFRIPAVVRTGRVLVAFAEGRRDSFADHGDIDVVARRSPDGGCTWGPLRVVTDAGRDTAGNPTPAVHPLTGRITLLTCRNPSDSVLPRRVFVQHSDDAGATFSPAREITGQVKPEGWQWYATGPGHALVLRHGPHPGRLLLPANHTYRAPGGETRHGAHSLYSDDGGRTWHLGYLAQPPGDALRLSETALAELPDGRIYAGARNQYGTSPATRAAALLAPGGTALLTPFTPQPALRGPVVQAGLLHLDGPGLLIHSAPADPRRRADLTLRISADQGRTWRDLSDPKRLPPGPAGYSDLVRLGRDTVGVLYETGRAASYETLTFARVPIPAPGSVAGPAAP
ncbi:sialidase family protein [Streptomyces aidingensis]|uniref:sialidase family protein n=1 Tax=Streptomyces aidingensis TaxID=910347 RepID=UPI001FED06C9|nr:sialidase family protein [Streptomyces aidingensis]